MDKRIAALGVVMVLGCGSAGGSTGGTESEPDAGAPLAEAGGQGSDAPRTVEFTDAAPIAPAADCALLPYYRCIAPFKYLWACASPPPSPQCGLDGYGPGDAGLAYCCQ
jgi:hypothetical protein